MKVISVIIAATLCTATLTGCQNPSQNAYRASEVGKASAVSFGSIVSVRQIDIIGENTGAGALVGGAAGAGAGSYVGKGSGNAWAIGAGALVGLAAGAMAEQAASDRKGVEYVVILETGVTMTVTQETPANERILAVGERVMLQNTGGYQRVLPASNLPTEVARPKGIKVTD